MSSQPSTTLADCVFERSTERSPAVGTSIRRRTSESGGHGASDVQRRCAARGGSFSPARFSEAAALAEGVCDHGFINGDDGGRARERPRRSRPSSSLSCWMRLFGNPARLERGGERLEAGVGGQIGKIIFALARGASRRRPARLSSPGMCCAPLSWMRCGEPSAIRTRRAANVAAAALGSFAPDDASRHLASRARPQRARRVDQGIGRLRGRPRPATGNTSLTLLG